MQVSEYLRARTQSAGDLAAGDLAGGDLVSNHADLRLYFEYPTGAVDAIEQGLKELTFGEYLVEQGVIDRFQLFRALQLQDRLPGVRLGECAAALGYASISKIERVFLTFAKLATVTVE